MVLLIGGVGSVGKTRLAHRIMKRAGVPYFSIDYLMMGIVRSDPNCGFTPMSSEESLNSRLWPLILEMAKTSIENRHSMIFEGVQILPRNIQDFGENYRSQIEAAFLVYSKEYILANYDAILANRSAIENRDDIDDKETLILKNASLLDECERHGQRHYLLDGDYAVEMEIIENDLCELMAKGD